MATGLPKNTIYLGNRTRANLYRQTQAHAFSIAKAKINRKTAQPRSADGQMDGRYLEALILSGTRFAMAH